MRVTLIANINNGEQGADFKKVENSGDGHKAMKYLKAA